MDDWPRPHVTPRDTAELTQLPRTTETGPLNLFLFGSSWLFAFSTPPEEGTEGAE